MRIFGCLLRIAISNSGLLFSYSAITGFPNSAFIFQSSTASFVLPSNLFDLDTVRMSQNAKYLGKRPEIIFRTHTQLIDALHGPPNTSVTYNCVHSCMYIVPDGGLCVCVSVCERNGLDTLAAG